MKRRKAPTVNRLAMGSLRAHARQYLSMTLGIVLAIFFASGMLLMGGSMIHTLRVRHNQQMGSQDAALLDAEEIAPETLIQDGWAQKVGSVYVLGDVPRAIEFPENLPLLIVGRYDEQATEFLQPRCLQGRMPAKPGEIAVERSALNQLRLPAELGGTIELELRIPRGEGQFLDKRVRKRYQLVGILNEQSRRLNAYDRVLKGSYLAYPSALVCEQEQVEPGGRAVIHRLLTLRPGVTFKKISDYFWTYHEMYMDEFPFNIIVSMEGNEPLVEALALVLVLAACMGIANAFSMRLNERRTQIGMLRAVGATRRQIRRIFGREALVIALISAPLAVGLSCAAVWGICRATGYVFYITPLFLAADLLVSLLCVMISALFPLMSASKISPMQAVRESALLRMKRRIRVKNRQSFRMPALLASRHQKLYPHKQAGISLIIALGMVIMVMGYGGADWMAGLEGMRPDKAFTMEVSGGGWERFVDRVDAKQRYTEADYQDIAALPMVKRIYTLRQLDVVNIALPRVTDYWAYFYTHGAYDFYTLETPVRPESDDKYGMWESTRGNYLKFLEQQPHDGQVISTSLMAYDEDVLRGMEACITDGKIDMDALNRGEEVIVVAPKSVGYSKTRFGWSEEFNPENPEQYDLVLENDMFFAGDELKLSHITRVGDGQFEEDFYANVRRRDWTGRIGAVAGDIGVYQSLNGLGSFRPGSILTTPSGLQAMGFECDGYDGFQVALTGVPDEEMGEYLHEEMENIAQRVLDSYCYDQLQGAQESMQYQRQLLMFAAAFILLFFAISISMVNNALTNRLRSDKRAIGTLRAVGASMEDIKESYLRQLLTMMGWGALMGVVMFLAGMEGLYWIGGGVGIGYIPYLFKRLPWWGLILAELGYLMLIFGVCALNLHIRLKDILRAGIVDNIREL